MTTALKNKSNQVFKVLLYEPTPMNQNITKALLQKMGWEVFVSDDITKISNEVSSKKIDGCLISIDSLDGVTNILQEINDASPEIVICGLSSSSKKQNLTLLKEAGLTEHYNYPIKQDHLDRFQKYLESDLQTALNDLPILDTTTLNSIRGLSDPGEDDFLKELAEVFFQRGPTIIAEIESAYVAQDPLKFERSSHSLKGSAGNLGAKRLMTICEKMEYAGRAKKLSHMEDSVKKMRQLYEEAKAALETEWLS